MIFLVWIFILFMYEYRYLVVSFWNKSSDNVIENTLKHLLSYFLEIVYKHLSLVFFNLYLNRFDQFCYFYDV